MQFQSPFYLILLNIEGNRIRTRKGMRFCIEGLTINSAEETKFGVLVSGAFGLRLRCRQSWFLLRVLRKNLFHASPLASGNFQYSLACRRITLISAFIVTWFFPLCACLFVQISSFYKYTSHNGLEAHPTPVRPQLN